MIHDAQLKGLRKLINSDIIKNVYPMVNYIDVVYNPNETPHKNGELYFDIHLNDDTINSENMYDKELDPYYLVDYHIKRLLNYLGIDGQYYFKWTLWGPGPDLKFITTSAS